MLRSNIMQIVYRDSHKNKRLKTTDVFNAFMLVWKIKKLHDSNGPLKNRESFSTCCISQFLAALAGFEPFVVPSCFQNAQCFSCFCQSRLSHPCCFNNSVRLVISGYSIISLEYAHQFVSGCFPVSSRFVLAPCARYDYNSLLLNEILLVLQWKDSAVLRRIRTLVHPFRVLQGIYIFIVNWGKFELLLQ